jgi:tRNA G18 (ribose-2'-O)-methylase SpoU
MTPAPRGYFGIGVERISKPMNLGALLRTAHAFGASFAFTVAAAFPAREVRLSDTSDSADHLPLYEAATFGELSLPKGCRLVGVELSADAVDLPSFRHPLSAAYILGPERGSLSPEAQARCAYLVKIPTKFCINVGLAGALVMYDRLISLSRFAPRPLSPGGPADALPTHVHGGQRFRRQER